MAKHIHGKLNRLQTELPEGMLVDAAWLQAKGYSSSLRSQYVRAGWLDQPARRVYRRSRGPLQWEQVVTSLQTALDYPLTIGGRSALEAQGYAHYLSATVHEVHLYGPERPPTWLAELPLEVHFHYHNSRKLFPDHPSVPPRVRAPSEDFGEEPASLTPGGYMIGPGGTINWPLRYSSPERAVLELLDELPNHESFHQVDMLMEGMANLSPRRLQELLGTCRSVKVKRLFFFFADRHQHRWLGQIDKSVVDLGAGKRMLVKDGVLDPHYHITVPGDLNGVS
ncbi:type IV toxin-antitoxin system AbiEi family antitoxin domain-containing protein [Sphingomonas oligophenolica]|uniref:Type IV toxin-antitoxin system AbiEi family antitoxin domain-containing protein n=2 Tax=Sphingomonas oligophenolica TaxID=301154 RepID=A0ABU9Y722_9SPHN